MPLTVGTAGHVDHGKTWLVRALTGRDTDRLREERRRGISIELGYAPLELPDGRVVSLVDVPGHERFVRTMVAGATGVDVFLLVIDASEGARAQTHEHLVVLRLLGIERGVVAVTKADAFDSARVALAVDEARRVVPGAPVVAVSARTGAGLDELRGALASVVGERARRPGPARLHVDRSFALRGIGTVVTGTLWSGSIGRGDELRLEPAGVPVRVRTVEVHDRPVERAEAARRVALSLPAVERTAVRRGDVLVERGAFRASYRLDVVLDEVEPLADGARLHVHHGTAETPARLVRIGERFAQIRLRSPVVAARGDRVVLRDVRTVGGGRVLDPAPPRHRDADRLELLASDDPVAIAHASVREPTRRSEIAARGLLAPEELDAGLAALEHAGEWYFSREWFQELTRSVARRLEECARASPLDPGVAVAELLPRRPWASAVLPFLQLDRRGGRAYAPNATPEHAGSTDAAHRLERELAEAGPRGARVDDRRLAAFLETERRVVRLGDATAVAPDAYERVKRTVLDECERTGSIRLARLRDLLGISRRQAQLLLERLDADGVTRRVGDERVVRRSARAGA